MLMSRSDLELIHSLNAMMVDVIRQAYEYHDSLLSDLGVSPEVAEILMSLSDSEVDKLTSTNQLLFTLRPGDDAI